MESAVKLERVSASDHLSGFPTAAGSSDLSLQMLGPLSRARKRLAHFCPLPKFISSCVLEAMWHSRILLANGDSLVIVSVLFSDCL